jgi:hypothetical protein
MKVKQFFAVGALALAAGAVLAAQASDAPLTRAEVKQSVRDARAADTLYPAGQAAPSEIQQPGTKSTLTRSGVKAQVRQARANGQMRNAGQAGGEELAAYQRALRTPSQETRADVKAQVRQARADGTLTPAGQREFSSEEQGVNVAHVAKKRSPRFASRAN